MILKIRYKHFVNDESVNDIKFAPNLSAIQRDQLRELCITYSDTLTTKPGKTKLVTHNIRTTTDSPIRLKPYRIPHSMGNEIKNVLDEIYEMYYTCTQYLCEQTWRQRNIKTYLLSLTMVHTLKVRNYLIRLHFNLG